MLSFLTWLVIGPIISRKVTKCFKEDNYQKIRKRVYLDGYKFLANLIRNLSQNNEALNNKIIFGEVMKGGNYYKPMQENLIEEVKRKIANQSYKFQLD